MILTLVQSAKGFWYLQMSITVPFFPWRKCKKLSLNEDSSTLSWWLLIFSWTSAILKLREIMFLLCNHRTELTYFFFLFSFLVKFLWILICFRFVLLWLDSLTVVASVCRTQLNRKISGNLLLRFTQPFHNMYVLWRTELKCL